jgi:hypothetical protein
MMSVALVRKSAVLVRKSAVLVRKSAVLVTMTAVTSHSTVFVKTQRDMSVKSVTAMTTTTANKTATPSSTFKPH